jgi:Leucine-rich repeat (LRR) protein
MVGLERQRHQGEWRLSAQFITSLPLFTFLNNSHQTNSPNNDALSSGTSSQPHSQGSIPTELGELSKLEYLRLSYNAFTGAAPDGLGDMKELQLLQLQSNRITKMPKITRLNDSLYNRSTFITDCGVPSAFDQALNCTNCTMCCE